MLNAKDLQTNLEDNYYNHGTVAQAIANDVLSVANAEAHPFPYFECTFPDGKNHLCIKTPAIVQNGPGEKYTAEDA